MKITTHPDNLQLVKELCDRDEFGDAHTGFGTGFGIEIVTNRLMDRDKPTGRYILPDGKRVKADEVRVPNGRFCELGPSDIRCLLWWGLIKEEREPLFYMIRDSFLRNWFQMMPMWTPPKYFVTACV